MMARVADFPAVWNRTPPPLRGRSGLTRPAFLIEEADWAARHDGRNCMLVDELRKTIEAEKDAEIIKPGDYSLKLHSVDKKYGDGDFLLSYVVEKSILQILVLILCH